MAKLTPKYEYKKNGTKSVKGYAISVNKLDTESCGFDKDTEIKIEYKKNEIRIKRVN